MDDENPGKAPSGELPAGPFCGLHRLQGRSPWGLPETARVLERLRPVPPAEGALARLWARAFAVIPSVAHRRPELHCGYPGFGRTRTAKHRQGIPTDTVAPGTYRLHPRRSGLDTRHMIDSVLVESAEGGGHIRSGSWEGCSGLPRACLGAVYLNLDQRSPSDWERAAEASRRRAIMCCFRSSLMRPLSPATLMAATTRRL
jgi:hypothetical protein